MTRSRELAAISLMAALLGSVACSKKSDPKPEPASASSASAAVVAPPAPSVGRRANRAPDPSQAEVNFIPVQEDFEIKAQARITKATYKGVLTKLQGVVTEAENSERVGRGAPARPAKTRKAPGILSPKPRSASPKTATPKTGPAAAATPAAPATVPAAK